jgi:predicted Abi (CAAX) family protease
LQFAQANAQTKNCKRACFANADKIVFKKFPNASKKIKIHRHTARQSQQTMTHKLNINKAHSDTVDRRPAGNSGLAKVAVQCSADTFVVNQSLVLRLNICGENRHLRQARKRYTAL